LDLTISTGTLSVILGILGGGGLLGLLGKIYALRKTIDDKRDEKSCVICRGEVDARVQAIKDLMSVAFDDLRKELNEALDKRASKAEVIAHTTLLAQHTTELEVLKTKLDVLTESSKRNESMLERVLDRLSRQPTLPPPA
jgi:hypothetical protein